MSTEGQRPDPDALLATLGDSKARMQCGRLKIFFGAAPGVGKTYAMLEAGQRERRSGVDVVVGYVEPHQRPDTIALLDGFEILPLRQIEHRGISLAEFDLEGALARQPKLILIDELAHSNVPGSTHTKRWQDVQQLLDNGIDVFSTLNVQHLESLNDQLAQITGVVVKERIPDDVFESAWEVELVDLPPDDLIDRLRKGKVYIPEQANHALEKFFRKGNLFALRELALRRTAERVDKQVEEFRRAQPIPSTWSLGDRLLVCVGPSPHSAKIVRAAKRMANSLKCPWIAAYVERVGATPLSPQNRARLLANLRLAEKLGAATTFLSGPDTVDEVIHYARKHNVSKIIVGKPTQPRWRELIAGSFVYELTRRCGEIDLYVISGDSGNSEERAPASKFTGRSSYRDYVRAIAVVGLCTVIGVMSYEHVAPVNIIMVYLLGVVAISIHCGRGPSFLASFLGVAVFDFAFVPPRGTFAVQDSQYLFTFFVMLLTGLLISSLTSRIRDQVTAARDGEARNYALLMLSRELAVAKTIGEVIDACIRNLQHAIPLRAVFLNKNAAGRLEALAFGKEALAPSERGVAVANWVFDNRRVAGLGTDTLPSADATYYPLTSEAETFGVLAVKAESAEGWDPTSSQLIDAVLGQTAAALERIKVSQDSERMRVEMKEEQLRSALLSSVSHDLRTPLAAIEGAGSTLLLQYDQLAPTIRAELLGTVVDEAEHLNRLVANLLDATRLEGGVLAAQREWESVEEIIGSALSRTNRLLQGRELELSVPADLPLIRGDAVLLQQAVVNLIENATKYSPPKTPITISAAQKGDRMVIEVADRGPGIRSEDIERIFDKFYRVADSQSRTGSGLGLTVAKGVVSIHEGDIVAENRPGGGALFRITLPLETHSAQPTVEEASVSEN